jgi:hypothetical protein
VGIREEKPGTQGSVTPITVKGAPSMGMSYVLSDNLRLAATLPLPKRVT